MIRFALFTFSLIFTLSSSALFAGKAVSHEEFDGDKAYLKKAYDTAISYYSDAIRRDNSKAITWYKLGNAHYRLHHLGQAALCYERALVRKPGFTQAAENLALIQKQVDPGHYKEPLTAVRLWRSLTQPSRSNMHALIALCFIACPLLALAFARFQKKSKNWIPAQLIVASFVIGACFFALSLISAFRYRPENIAVIIRPDAALREAAQGAAKATMVNLPEGLVVKVDRKDAEQIRVTLPDGRSGSLQLSDIALVE